MPRSGGTYSLPAGNPVVSGATISSTTHNSTMTDIADALTASLAKDGQTVPTANLPMGGYRHTNVDDAGARTDYARADQVQDSALTYLTSVAGTNTITATAPLSLAAYTAGQRFTFIPAGTNTGATTLNVSSIGAKNIYRNGAALAGGEIVSGSPVEVVYDGTQFQLVGNAYVAPPSWVPIETLTASSSGSLDFDVGIDSTYDAYALVIKGLAPATDGVQLLMRIATAGPTWQAGAGAYQWGATIAGAGGSSVGDGSSSGGPTTAICVNGSATSKVGSAAGEGLDATVFFASPAGTTQRKRFHWNGAFTTAAGVDVTVNGAGSYGSTTAIVGVRLLFSSGNIASGSATLYGVRT